MRQDQALYLMSQGKSVFLTGPAGSGKTYVLNDFIKQARKQGKEVAVTASTGIAATHIGGSTIHSWSGLGIRDSLSAQDRTWLSGNKHLLKRYNMADILVIDEVSMLHGARLDMVNEVCKLMRDSTEPFGGLQIVLTGDLFQLPPVNRGGGPEDFVHNSLAWQELDPAICYLETQFRQSDGALLGMLEALRAAEFDEMHEELLRQRIGIQPDEETVVTRLYTHNVNVDEINRKQLDALESDVEVFEMETAGNQRSIESLQKSVLAPVELHLKTGAEVMFVANNFGAGFANGTRGTVVEFEDDLPVVELQTGHRRIKVEKHTWRLEEDGRERASVTQLPLRLAWAITIHKSQGMSLDSALIDLSRAFTYGMGYVALSRVRSLEGLYLTGINPMALRLHPEIFVFDQNAREISGQIAAEVGSVPVAEETVVAAYDERLLKELKSWRAGRAASEKVPAYIIAHDKTLEDIAKRQPASERQLLAINGFGAKKLDAYGPDILSIINNKTV